MPYFGICFGMQMAVIEAARNLVGLAKEASSTEFGPRPRSPWSALMTEWMRGNELEVRRAREATSAAPCGSARIPATLSKGSHRGPSIYGDLDLGAPPPPLRGEHPLSRPAGGRRRALLRHVPDGLLPEIIELPDHPWFIGVQYHPELKSRPFDPHPLFASFIAAAVEQSRLV